jgi:hypothetical protein
MQKADDERVGIEQVGQKLATCRIRPSRTAR